MPKDKTASHEKIVKAAMQEFLERGYEQASMKRIADAVGMTSAALYRHFENKSDMFESLVQPAINAVEAWTKEHTKESMDQIKDLDAAAADELAKMWDFDSGMNDVRLVLDVMYEYPQEFRLILFRSAGTKYENWCHDMIETATESMMDFVSFSKAQGFAARDISRHEMHMLVTAYFSAMIEPLAHDLKKDEAESYLRTMLAFFTPGWRMITGI